MGTEGSTVLEPLWRGLPHLDHSTVSGSATCALPARFDAVRGARDFTRETLQRWRLEGEFDTVALVVSELVTNALRHGVPGHGAPANGASGSGVPGHGVPGHGMEPVPPVRLDLMCWAARLVCAVRDPSGAPPRTIDNCTEYTDFTAESGRGLCLVESFSDGWGWHPLTGMMRGKVVWALFRLTPVRSVQPGPDR
ncbi:ATP-binding protein [Streptomyces sp. HNM0575]|uniref:ATP-binding protein n=1 Tax=Streptomyces sp. HNM0575 TaxID=2716338 RepID=UPI00145F2AF0|nr:ATP-binding protein [Streptomyces sp. HNM0575]NLU75474.1 ATP-binding protein [Streptomyces sp. HNM0575]